MEFITSRLFANLYSLFATHFTTESLTQSEYSRAYKSLK